MASSCSLIATNLMISLLVHSLLPLLLFLFDIRLLPEQHEDVQVFTTDAMLLNATCSWFCTRLIEFSSMSLCKISFFSSSNARLPSLILKENRRNIQKQPLGDFCKKSVFFCHVPMLSTLVDLTGDCILTGDCFSSQIISLEIRTGSFSNEFRCFRAINKFRTSTELLKLPGSYR